MQTILEYESKSKYLLMKTFHKLMEFFSARKKKFPQKTKRKNFSKQSISSVSQHKFKNICQIIKRNIYNLKHSALIGVEKEWQRYAKSS